MKIQPISDVHLDCLKPVNREGKLMSLIHPDADVIILAGDLGEYDFRHEIKNQISQIEKPVIYIAGNHEYWGTKFRTYTSELKELYADLSNVHILEKEFLIVEDVVFICGTLWTDLSNPIVENMVKFQMARDFERIIGMSGLAWNTSHREMVKFIQQCLTLENFRDLKKIVVTHHGPTFKAVPEKYKFDWCNAGYQSGLDHILESEKAPDIWIHGHSHEFMDEVIGNTRVIRNPYGYADYGEMGTGFDINFLIDSNNLKGS